MKKLFLGLLLMPGLLFGMDKAERPVQGGTKSELVSAVEGYTEAQHEYLDAKHDVVGCPCPASMACMAVGCCVLARDFNSDLGTKLFGTGLMGLGATAYHANYYRTSERFRRDKVLTAIKNASQPEIDVLQSEGQPTWVTSDPAMQVAIKGRKLALDLEKAQGSAKMT